jgi:uncharacterized protein involved in exopolysaccharide biosynthesis
VLERRGVRGRRGEVRGRWSSFATIRVVFVDSTVGAKRSIDRRLNRVRREAERQWTAERGKLRKEMECHRASALKAKRELDMVKRLRDAERDELRATRAALMEMNRDAKGDEVNRVKEMTGFENTIRHERARREAAESERDELMDLLHMAHAKLEHADAKIRSVDRMIANDVRRVCDAINDERMRSIDCTVSNVGTTQTLLDRLSELYESRFAKSREALREISS